ncbi:acylneuraminate cytidylyltransferase family protein [Cognatishimia sp. 1_MG-2023]|uniref:acylneuraminate cytidylyltransferase family protein n=1 Tax=Cognatishimia sp. 1_MG-2023 TaxID=3062642 RepID=UPI0026E3D352|nr:acylneuraminate cytidylyltransferase family protein [Cognatishimia sp. 1_MG-2023]MDO6728355.1 acylneuraminate cytidylyltransferase family protein [Cognatishimia sp. 1_MG-2023]
MVKILAIVPARGGSKRLPRKNVLPLAGKPLINWTIEFANAQDIFSRVVVSSDDDEILDVACACGAESSGRRPAHLSGDHASSIDVLVHELNQLETKGECYDFVALLQPTTPFRNTDRWRQALNILANRPEVPSVIGVQITDTSPFHAFEMSKNNDLSALFPEKLSTRSQDLSTTVTVNGSLYLVRADVLKNEEKIFFPTSAAVVCDTVLERIDIDTNSDFLKAEAIFSQHSVR